MTVKKTHIYLLPMYANESNLIDNRYETEHESKIRFAQGDIILELAEANSLIEDRYCLSIMSAKYVLEGTVSKNEIKEAMIHHHPDGHPWKHLQFKLMHKDEVIRVNLEPVDESDYVRCIKGFLHISLDLLRLEKEENHIDQDLIDYFFDGNIKELKPFRNYLLNKIRASYEQGNILDDSNKAIGSLTELRSEKRLLPFFDW